jgi:integrase
MAESLRDPDDRGLQKRKSPRPPAVRCHDLRYTAATLLFAQGIDACTIMETLGRSQISLTLNSYPQVLPALQGEGAPKLVASLPR